MASQQKLLWKLYPSYLIITLLSLFAVGLFASAQLRSFYIQHTESELKNRAVLIGQLVPAKFNIKDRKEVDALCDQLGRQTATRFTVVSASGEVIGDTDLDPAIMENHSDRIEVAAALSGKTGVAIRFSPTEKKKTVYVAIPLKKDGRIIGVVRAAMPMTEVSRALNQIYLKIALLGILTAVLAVVVSLVVSGRINRILLEMKRGAERFAGGDLSHRLYMPESEEMSALAQALNEMAAQLQDRIQAVTGQKNELEAVLSSMVESVLVVDREHNILRFNRAAAQLLGLKDADRGRSIQETIRNPGLQKFAEKTLGAKDPLSDEILAYQEDELYLMAHGTLLKDARDQSVAALLVLHDITNLKKLENMRKEFVANVSHELKTPITAIKGFVETLKEGAAREPENLAKFLEIVGSHADRLNAIIEDLLILSRIEQSEETGQVVLEETGIKAVLESAALLNQGKAAEKKIRIELEAPEGLKAKINPELIEQAASNLIDNAVKYSEAGGVIRVVAAQTGRELAVTVQDFGTGIPKEHLSRIFERFYRVDKARSRNLGGTGLGLAIVKHIVQAHRGRVAVESAVGKGSKFFIFLPID